MSFPERIVIVAMTRRHVIGRAGTIPWHLGSDLRRFKALTLGHPLILGRRTYDSIGRALPGRRSIVLSRDPEFSPQDAECVDSLDQAWEVIAGSLRCFIIGGGEVYRQALPLADRLYVSWVEVDAEGDTYFPQIEFADWQLQSSESFPRSERDDWPHTFEILSRIR